MGALPSKEFTENPASLLMCNCSNLVMCYVPLTPHFFPSHRSLAFQQLFHARNHQSALYAYDVRRLDGQLPVADADMFRAAQQEDWGGEVDETDPSVHYYDGPTGDHDTDSGRPTHIPKSIEDPADLYDALITAPIAHGQLVDTNEEMLQLYAAEQAWRAALEAHIASGGPGSPPEPPQTFLYPLMEAIALRITAEEAEVLRTEHRRKQLRPTSQRESAGTDPKGTKGSSKLASATATPQCEVGDAHERQLSELSQTLTLNSDAQSSEFSNMVRRPRYRFEDEAKYKDGRVHLVEEDGVLLHFAYNPHYTHGRSEVWEACRHDVLWSGSDGDLDRCASCGQHVQRHLDHRELCAYPTTTDPTQEFTVPISTLRIVGVHGLLPAKTRGTPWLRGELSQAVDDAIERMPRRPPVMRLCRFIDGSIGDKKLNRAALLSILSYHKACLRTGLPAPLTRPLWSTSIMSNIPYLQMVRETFFRARAAVLECEGGNTLLRECLEDDKENNFVNFINTNLYVMRKPPAADPIRGGSKNATEDPVRRKEGGTAKCCEEIETPIEPPSVTSCKGSHCFNDFSSRLEPHAPFNLEYIYTVEAEEKLRLPVGGAAVTPLTEGQPQHPNYVLLERLAEFEEHQRSLPAAQRVHSFPLYDCGMVEAVRGRHLIFRIRPDALKALLFYGSQAAAPIFIGAYMNPTDATSLSYGGTVRLTAPHAPTAEGCEGGDPDAYATMENVTVDMAVLNECRARGITVVYSVSDPSIGAAGPSAGHRMHRLQLPVPLPATSPLALQQAYEREKEGYVHSYAAWDFRDGDLVVFNCDTHCWEHYEHVQLRRRLSTIIGQRRDRQIARRTGKALADGAGEVVNVSMSARLLYVSLDVLLLSWTKWVVDNRFFENRHDPGWMHNPEPQDALSGLVKVGRYFIWSFRLNHLRFFYGVIPKFVKERLRRQRKRQQLLSTKETSSMYCEITNSDPHRDHQPLPDEPSENGPTMGPPITNSRGNQDGNPNTDGSGIPASSLIVSCEHPQAQQPTRTQQLPSPPPGPPLGYPGGHLLVSPAAQSVRMNPNRSTSVAVLLPHHHAAMQPNAEPPLAPSSTSYYRDLGNTVIQDNKREENRYFPHLVYSWYGRWMPIEGHPKEGTCPSLHHGNGGGNAPFGVRNDIHNNDSLASDTAQSKPTTPTIPYHGTASMSMGARITSFSSSGPLTPRNSSPSDPIGTQPGTGQPQPTASRNVVLASASSSNQGATCKHSVPENAPRTYRWDPYRH